MKKLIALILSLVCLTVFLNGCGSEEPTGEVCFDAEVSEVLEGCLMTVCTDSGNSGISIGHEISVGTDVVSADGVPELKAGDNIRVVFNGEILYSYPASLGEVFAIYLLDENGNVIE